MSITGQNSYLETVLRSSKYIDLFHNSAWKEETILAIFLCGRMKVTENVQVLPNSQHESSWEWTGKGAGLGSGRGRECSQRQEWYRSTCQASSALSVSAKPARCFITAHLQSSFLDLLVTLEWRQPAALPCPIDAPIQAIDQGTPHLSQYPLCTKEASNGARSVEKESSLFLLMCVHMCV